MFEVNVKKSDIEEGAVCVEINNCTNEEGKCNCVCTFNMGGRKFEEKKYFVRTGKKLERKNILLFIIGKFVKEIDLFLKFGNLFRK